MASGKITIRAIDAITVGPRDKFLWDDEVRGFGLKVTPADSRTFMFQYRMGGRGTKTRRYTIGSYGKLTPDEARTIAKRLANEVAAGTDPLAAKKDRERLAIDTAFDICSQRFLGECTGKGWHNMVERTFRLHVSPVWRSKPLPAIDRADVAAVINRLPRQQQALRRNVFAVMRRFLNWAVKEGVIDRSPVESVESPEAVPSRDRTLTPHEVVAIWNAAPGAGPMFGPILRLLLATGLRREEVAALDWHELNRKEKTVTLPRGRSKNRKINIIPLNTLAVEIIDTVAGGEKWPRQGFVFATSGGKSFASFYRGKTRLDKLLSKLSDWRLHDCRRTVATNLQELGVRFEVVEAAINHVGKSQSGIAAIYQRHDWAKEKREALDAWGDRLARLLSEDENRPEAPDDNNVVPFAQRA